MTEHIEAKLDEIASSVIMPGDPLRAKMIAEKYLDDYKLVNHVRNMLAYTGTYQGKKITVMASGMGMPSIGIYAYELYHYYHVETIIRVGTCGAYTSDVNLYDTVLASKIYSDSNYAYNQNKEESHIIEADQEFNQKIMNQAKKDNIPLKVGCIHSSDVFYKENDNFREINEKYGCLGVEMESFALFHYAKVFHRKAVCLLTISNSLVDGSTTTSEERQNSFLNMIELALNTIE